MNTPREYNAAVDLIGRNLKAGRGQNIAFIDPERRLSYGELASECHRMGNLLAAHGVGREARVAMILLDTCDFPIIFWGAIQAGVIPVALNTLLNGEQYHYILADSRAEVLFVSAQLLPTVAPILPQLAAIRRVFVVGDDAGEHVHFRDELARHERVYEAAPTCADEVAFWLYSSGSTGMPKGVKHVHSSPLATAELYGQGVLGMREDDVVYSAAKLFFAYGLGNAMTFPMSVGATAILLPQRPTPEAVFAVLRAHQPTMFFGVPTLYAAMLANAEGGADLGCQRLRICVSAGEALPEQVGTEWRSRIGVDVLDGVGSTEMLHIFLSNRVDQVNYGYSGRAVPGYELRLVDESGQPVTAGEIGELLVRGPSAAEGYWNQRIKSRHTFAGEWTRTGDKFVSDEEGLYLYCGRTDDMFKVSGIWVSPFEVESALMEHEAVLEAAVVPAEDQDGLLKPKAFVVLKADAAPKEEDDDSTGQAKVAELTRELQAHVKDKAGLWKYPRWVVYVESLPKTATGKVQRYKLRGS